VVWIKTGYYRVLQGQDGVKAALKNHKTLEETCEKMEKLLGIGRIQKYDLDRAYQEKLQAWEGYLSAKDNYEQLLDEFKLEIGAPVRTEFCLDEKELDILREAGASQESLSMEETIENVLDNRLDLANLADELTDRLHKVFRTAYNPNGRLDFIDHSPKVSDEQLEHPSLEYLEKQFNLEFSENLSFDQLNEYNEFRKDMIALSRKYKEYAQKVNKIIMDVRKEYRDMEEATERYRLQLESINLAQKRANDSFALLRNNIGNVGDVLRAQDDLYKANIGATDALVDSAIAIIQIQVQPDVMWRKWDWKN
jgi:outer membrane protein TolC